MRTVITHFYNEEYLLPWWLMYHRQHFDQGILIDYHSTDRSVEICRGICPDWPVFTSMNQYFDAAACDYEIEFYERQVQGWRIALTTTEFIVGNLDKLMNDSPIRQQYFVPGIRFTAWNPAGHLDPAKPLWHQIHTGIDYHDNPTAHQCRSLHNFTDIKYTTGRHYLPHNTQDAMIFHYAHCLIGEPMIRRRLQIQHKISPSDKELGLGNHHYINTAGMDIHGLEHMHKSWIAVGEKDCSGLMANVLNSDKY